MKQMFAVLILCIVSAAAFAQDVASPGGGMRAERAMQMLETRFANANTTHDGKLTREQAKAGMPRVATYFDHIDTARTGYVTLPQIEAFMQQQAAAR